MPIEITMPRLSDTMETGSILKWNVSEGDAVTAGDAVADIETDKATMEMQVYDDGTLAKILVAEGQTVEVGTPIAVLAEADEDPQEVAAAVTVRPGAAQVVERPEGDQAAAATPAAIPAPAAEAASTAPPSPQAPPDTTADGRTRVSPVARRLADEHGLDIRGLAGSGPGGRIIKRDVLAALAAAEETAAAIVPSVAVPVPHAPAEIAVPLPPLARGLEPRRVPLSNMRQTIARRLVESKTTIPHYQVTVTFNMDPLLELRRMLNDQLVGQGVKLSVNDFLVRGCALVIGRHPEFNASWAGDSIEIHGQINVGVAIALPAERGGGLVVATIRDADHKTLREISIETRQLAGKARTRGLSPEEMADSTFTLSNLGMFGVDHFTAIINPPNSAILAVGAAQERPVVRDGQIVVGREMSATLSLDHRVIDGALAAQFLESLAGLIENPATLLV